MYQIDFNKPQNVHFIGIGGISMSGLAEILLGRGFHITGSDSQDSALLNRLRSKGAERTTSKTIAKSSSTLRRSIRITRNSSRQRRPEFPC